MASEIAAPTTPVQPVSRQQARSRWHARLRLSWATAALLLLPALLLARFINAPFERDEAIYSVVAQGLLNGDVLYQGPWDHKPPLIFVWYAMSFVLFGESVVAPRILALVFFLGSTYTVLTIAKLLLPRRDAYIAALTMGSTAGLVMLRPAANAEIFTTLPALGALLAAVHGLRVGRSPGTGAWQWFLVAGLLSGFAVLTKQVVLFPTAAIGLTILASSDQRARDVMVFVGGGMIALGLVVLPFVVAGGWDDFFYANFTYNRLYFAADGPDPLTSTIRFAVIAAPFVFIALLGAKHLWSTDRRPEARLVLLWSVASVASVFSTGRAYEHYWVMTFPALALLAGYAASAGLLRQPTSRSLKRVGFVGALGVTGFLSLSLNLPPFLHSTAEDRHVAQYGSTGELDIQTEIVAGRVADLLEPGERFYEVGRETGIYFHADLLPPVRFMFDRQFYLDPATLDETMASLRSDPPRLILLTRPQDDPPYADGVVPIVSVRDRLVPPQIASLIEERYELLERAEFADVYRLTAPR